MNSYYKRPLYIFVSIYVDSLILFIVLLNRVISPFAIFVAKAPFVIPSVKHFVNIPFTKLSLAQHRASLSSAECLLSTGVANAFTKGCSKGFANI